MQHLLLRSADSHVIEPPDLWSSRIERKYRHRAPRLVSSETGDWWFVDGLRTMSVTGGTEIGVRFEQPEKLRRESRFAEVVKGAYDTAARLKDMEQDGVAGEVVYPTLALNMWRHPDSELLTALFRCYTDWVAEFSRDSKGLVRAAAPINLDDIDEGVRSMEHAARHGAAAAMISVFPPEERWYGHPMYDRVWAAAQDLDLAISLHVGTNRTLPPAPMKDRTGPFLFPTPGLQVTVAHWVQVSLADMIFSGVFQRYPALRVVSVEHDVAWAPHFLTTMDYIYTQKPRRPEWTRFKNEAIPSDFFHRNVFITFQEDTVGTRLRDVIGVENLMWGSDYPHPESTFPRTRQVLARVFAGVPEAEVEKIVYGNVSRVFRFP